MLENLKKLTSEMDSKTEFAEHLAEYFSLSAIYITQNWLQRKWTIPKNKLPKVVEIAQAYLFNQTKRKRTLLKDTGYNIEVEFEEIKTN